jgi:hypothetical protein
VNVRPQTLDHENLARLHLLDPGGGLIAARVARCTESGEALSQSKGIDGLAVSTSGL